MTSLPYSSPLQAYAATVFLEATTVSEGRGTTTPFSLFGAPGLDALALQHSLNTYYYSTMEQIVMDKPQSQTLSSQLSFPDSYARDDLVAIFRASYFEPTFFKYNFTNVAGLQFFPNRFMDQTLTKEKSGASHPGLFELGMQILATFIANYSSLDDSRFVFEWDGSWFGHPSTSLIDMYAGTPSLRLLLNAGANATEIVKYYEKEVESFLQDRQQYLLY